MSTILTKLLQTDEDIIRLITQGKGESYANLARINFKPGELDRLNTLLARRATLVEIYTEESKNP